MEQNCNRSTFGRLQESKNVVDIHYQQTGEAGATNELGMREMQAKACEARYRRFLLIKAPLASGKSRALMFIALDKLAHRGLKRVVKEGWFNPESTQSLLSTTALLTKTRLHRPFGSAAFTKRKRPKELYGLTYDAPHCSCVPINSYRLKIYSMIVKYQKKRGRGEKT